jgi:hypothetical protein
VSHSPLLHRMPIEPPRRRQTVEDFKITPTFFSVGFPKLFWSVLSRTLIDLAGRRVREGSRETD